MGGQERLVFSLSYDWSENIGRRQTRIVKVEKHRTPSNQNSKGGKTQDAVKPV